MWKVPNSDENRKVAGPPFMRLRGNHTSQNACGSKRGQMVDAQAKSPKCEQPSDRLSSETRSLNRLVLLIKTRSSGRQSSIFASSLR